MTSSRTGPFDGKVAIVTGGASGIGRALAIALGRRGATVVIADIDAERAERVAGEIVGAGGNARAERVDVSSRSEVEALVAGVFSGEGRLDLLFNNAGIAVFGEARYMTSDQWRRLLEVNLHGVVHGVHAAYPRMVEQGFGHIVNTASMAGLVPSPGAVGYAMTKHALVGLSTSLRGEGAALGVRVSAVCPGFIDTPIVDALEYVQLDKEKLLNDPWVKLFPVDRCAEVILRGVRKNRAIITVTATARVAWWLYRLFPGFFATRLGAASMKRWRRLYAKPSE